MKLPWRSASGGRRLRGRAPAKNVGYRILEEHTQPDGSIRIKIKMQYNKHPLGEYMD